MAARLHLSPARVRWLRGGHLSQLCGGVGRGSVSVHVLVAAFIHFLHRFVESGRKPYHFDNIFARNKARDLEISQKLESEDFNRTPPQPSICATSQHRFLVLAVRKGGLPGGRGEQCPLKSPKWNVGAGLLDGLKGVRGK